MLHYKLLLLRRLCATSIASERTVFVNAVIDTLKEHADTQPIAQDRALLCIEILHDLVENHNTEAVVAVIERALTQP